MYCTILFTTKPLYNIYITYNKLIITNKSANVYIILYKITYRLGDLFIIIIISMLTYPNTLFLFNIQFMFI